MGFSGRFQAALGWAWCAGVLLGGAACAAEPSSQAWGEASDGLQMRIEPESSRAAVPTFRVAFRNSGDRDLVVKLGITLANGAKQYPNAVVLMLTDAQGKSRQLDSINPAFIAGRVDPFILLLPAGATFSVPIDLARYWAAASRQFEYKVTAGTYTLEAHFTGKSVSGQEANLDVQGISLMPFWKGTIASNRLRFEVRTPTG